MLEPSPSVPFRTVESPMIHSVGNAEFADVGGKYRPLPGAPSGAGATPICVLRGISAISTEAVLTYFVAAVSTALPFAESSTRNGLPRNAFRPDTTDDAMNSAPGKYV